MCIFPQTYLISFLIWISGCEIAPNPDEAMLPHGVQIVRCHDDCQVFPSFMTPLQLLAINDKLISDGSSSSGSTGKDNHALTSSIQSDYTMSSRDIDVEMDLHRHMLEGCIILQKPAGFQYGPGVEFIARPANLRPCMLSGAYHLIILSLYPLLTHPFPMSIFGGSSFTLYECILTSYHSMTI